MYYRARVCAQSVLCVDEHVWTTKFMEQIYYYDGGRSCRWGEGRGGGEAT